MSRTMRAAVAVGCILVIVFGAWGGWELWRCVPFVFASYAAWAGILLALVALVFLLKPVGWLGMPSRARPGLVAAIGVSTTVACLLWPCSIRRISVPEHRIDEFLPEYQFSEYHEVRTHAPLQKVLEAARQVSLADMPSARLLMRLRALADGKLTAPAVDPTPLVSLLQQPGTGFLALDVSNPAELVLGMAGRPWADEPPPALKSAADFLAFSLPGHVRVALDIRTVDEGGGGVLVSTETRILGNDVEARRVFSRYWRLIYPGSAIIRQVWLDAIIARAEGKAGPR